jgi:hypothetical protein
MTKTQTTTARTPMFAGVLTPSWWSTPEPAADIDTVRCPDCGLPAVVEWRTTIRSTGTPVEHVKFACPVGHRYFMPAEGLE